MSSQPSSIDGSTWLNPLLLENRVWLCAESCAHPYSWTGTYQSSLVILESSLSSSTWKVLTKRVMRSRMVLEATTSDHNPRLAPDHGFRGSKTSADQCFPAVGFPWQSQLNLPLDNHESRPSPLLQTVNTPWSFHWDPRCPGQGHEVEDLVLEKTRRKLQISLENGRNIYVEANGNERKWMESKWRIKLKTNGK